METDTPEGPASRKTNSRQDNKDRNSPADILITELTDRAARSNPTLKEHLTGAILVEITDLSQRYFIDWRGAQLSASKIEGAPTNDATCTISLSSKDLAKIASGDINPQIAMVSDKVRVAGNSGLAVYFFNLVAPRMMG